MNYIKNFVLAYFISVGLFYFWLSVFNFDFNILNWNNLSLIILVMANLVTFFVLYLNHRNNR